jgi:hypothetical protein
MTSFRDHAAPFGSTIDEFRELRLPVMIALGASARPSAIPEKALLRRQALTPYSSLEAAEIVLPRSRDAHHPIRVLASNLF